MNIGQKDLHTISFCFYSHFIQLPKFSGIWGVEYQVFSYHLYQLHLVVNFLFLLKIVLVWERKTQENVHTAKCWRWSQSKWCSAVFYSFSKSLNPLILDMHRCLELFPASKCPIWGRHATVGQRCVNLAVPKHTQSGCQELDYLKQFSAQKQRRMLSWSLQPFPANALGYDRWQETGAAN